MNTEERREAYRVMGRDLAEHVELYCLQRGHSSRVSFDGLDASAFREQYEDRRLEQFLINSDVDDFTAMERKAIKNYFDMWKDGKFIPVTSETRFSTE